MENLPDSSEGPGAPSSSQSSDSRQGSSQDLVACWREEVDDLQEALSNTERACASLRIDNNALREQLLGLERKLQSSTEQFTAERDALLEENMGRKKKIADLDIELKFKTREVNSCQKEIAMYENKIIPLQEAFLAKKSRLEKMESTNKLLTNEIEEKDKLLKETKESLRESLDEIERLKAQLAKKDRMWNSLVSEIENVGDPGLMRLLNGAPLPTMEMDEDTLERELYGDSDMDYSQPRDEKRPVHTKHRISPKKLLLPTREEGELPSDSGAEEQERALAEERSAIAASIDQIMWTGTPKSQKLGSTMESDRSDLESQIHSPRVDTELFSVLKATGRSRVVESPVIETIPLFCGGKEKKKEKRKEKRSRSPSFSRSRSRSPTRSRTSRSRSGSYSRSRTRYSSDSRSRSRRSRSRSRSRRRTRSVTRTPEVYYEKCNFDSEYDSYRSRSRSRSDSRTGRSSKRRKRSRSASVSRSESRTTYRHSTSRSRSRSRSRRKRRTKSRSRSRSYRSASRESEASQARTKVAAKVKSKSKSRSPKAKKSQHDLKVEAEKPKESKEKKSSKSKKHKHREKSSPILEKAMETSPEKHQSQSSSEAKTQKETLEAKIQRGLADLSSKLKKMPESPPKRKEMPESPTERKDIPPESLTRRKEMPETSTKSKEMRESSTNRKEMPPEPKKQKEKPSARERSRSKSKSKSPKPSSSSRKRHEPKLMPPEPQSPPQIRTVRLEPRLPVEPEIEPGEIVSPNPGTSNRKRGNSDPAPKAPRHKKSKPEPRVPSMAIVDEASPESDDEADVFQTKQRMARYRNALEDEDAASKLQKLTIPAKKQFKDPKERIQVLLKRAQAKLTGEPTDEVDGQKNVDPETTGKESDHSSDTSVSEIIEATCEPKPTDLPSPVSSGEKAPKEEESPVKSADSTSSPEKQYITEIILPTTPPPDEPPLPKKEKKKKKVVHDEIELPDVAGKKPKAKKKGLLGTPPRTFPPPPGQPPTPDKTITAIAEDARVQEWQRRAQEWTNWNTYWQTYAQQHPQWDPSQQQNQWYNHHHHYYYGHSAPPGPYNYPPAPVAPQAHDYAQPPPPGHQGYVPPHGPPPPYGAATGQYPPPDENQQTETSADDDIIPPGYENIDEEYHYRDEPLPPGSEETPAPVVTSTENFAMPTTVDANKTETQTVDSNVPAQSAMKETDTFPPLPSVSVPEVTSTVLPPEPEPEPEPEKSSAVMMDTMVEGQTTVVAGEVEAATLVLE